MMDLNRALVEVESHTVLWAVLTLQASGLLIAMLARLRMHAPRAAWYQAGFFVALTLMGLLTMLSLPLGAACWLSSAATFCGMVLVAVCDFRRSSTFGPGLGA